MNTRESTQDFSDWPSKRWYQRKLARNLSKTGAALGHVLAGKRILKRVKELRKQKAVVLTIIHQRGLRLPVSVEQRRSKELY